MNNILLEVCIDSVNSARECLKGGAHRVELCSALNEGGLSPSIGFLKKVKSIFNGQIPVFVMIRQRAGDFMYSQDELEIMKEDLKLFKENGADGFVFGLLTNTGQVDKEGCQELLKIANPLPCTFHRAFDLVPEPLEALETIIELGFKRILTSGQRNTAFEGIPLITQLVNQASGRILIMPGSGVNSNNANIIIKETGVKEIHSSASSVVKSKINFCNKDQIRGIIGENEIKQTDSEKIIKIIETFS